MNELTLSSAMGVSRGTVREAIRSLADSGLIDLIANRGAFVHETTLAEIRNLYDLRGAIFAMACAAAARRVGEGAEPKLVARLERNLEQMRATHAGGDTARYYALNIEFHDLLLQAAGNPKAKTMYDNLLVKEMHLFRRKGLSVATNIAQSIDEHAAITRAVAAADSEKCAPCRAGPYHRGLRPLHDHGRGQQLHGGLSARIPNPRQDETMTNPLHDALFCPARGP